MLMKSICSILADNTCFFLIILIKSLEKELFFRDGTTDITRTVHYTHPKPEEKSAYTRVLLGNLDLERVQWPQKNKIHGGDLDVLARRRLWEVKKDIKNIYIIHF